MLVFSCPVDKTAKFLHGDRQNQRFSMQAFRYVDPFKPIVYIHCKVILCHKFSKDERCHSGCFGNTLNHVKNESKHNSANAKSLNTTVLLLEAVPSYKNMSSGSMNFNGKYDKKILLLKPLPRNYSNTILLLFCHFTTHFRKILANVRA